MKNWRTNLGGALGVLGTALVGVGVVPQLGGSSSKLLTYTAIAGFFISAFGKFFHALFAADAKTVADLAETMSGNTDIINKLQSGQGANPGPKSSL